MKIIYGSPEEKWVLCGTYLSASAVSALVLLREQMLAFPYLGLPLYLLGCTLALCLLPTEGPAGSLSRGGLRRTLPALLLMGAIFLASSFTFPPAPTATFLPDLGFHAAEFFALGLLTARMVAPGTGSGLTRRSFVLALSIVLGYGLLDEIHQSFVPGRDPDGMDLLVDASAGLFGILAYPVLFTTPKKATPD